jgi:hypothetical protein
MVLKYTFTGVSDILPEPHNFSPVIGVSTPILMLFVRDLHAVVCFSFFGIVPFFGLLEVRFCICVAAYSCLHHSLTLCAPFYTLLLWSS